MSEPDRWLGIQRPKCWHAGILRAKRPYSQYGAASARKEHVMAKITLEIRAAEGGADARLFTGDLARAYIAFASRHS